MLQDVPEVEKTTGKVKPEAEVMYPVPEDVQEQPQEQPELVSTSVGEIRRQERAKRLKRSSRRYLKKFICANKFKSLLKRHNLRWNKSKSFIRA